MIDSSLKDIAAALRAKTVSAVELATDSLARIKARDGQINAFVTVDEAGALAAARAADARLAEGSAGPLTGIPLAHKDVFCTEGVLTTCGSKMLANFAAPYDAHVVSLLKQAGAVMVGKTNMDEFAMGSSNESSNAGPTRNPWDTSKVPGGSSGGSAAAVAARMVPIATGTDTGGSVRQPAALCGITGIKPTYGSVSRFGMIAYASSLDQGGAFARSAEDCATLLTAMMGHDPRDSTSLERSYDDCGASLAQPLAGLRIGLPREFFAEGMSADVRTAVDAAIAEYRKLGATLVPVAPGGEASALADLEGLDSGSVILVGERAATLPGLLTAAVAKADATGARLAWMPRRAGDMGAIEAGCLPALLPGDDSAIRRKLLEWLDRKRLRPRIVGEFDDTALMTAFGRAGVGAFAVPTAIEQETLADGDLVLLGRASEVRVEYYAISVERRLTHPCVLAISEAAKTGFESLETGIMDPE